MAALFIGIVLVPLILVGPVYTRELVPDRFTFISAFYWPAVLVLSVGFLATLYHVAVPAKKQWRRALPGAFFTVALWVLGSYLVRWALDFSDGGMSIYGPLAAPIAIMLWLYVISISVLIGAALNAALEVDELWRASQRDLPTADPESETRQI